MSLACAPGHAAVAVAQHGGPGVPVSQATAGHRLAGRQLAETPALPSWRDDSDLIMWWRTWLAERDAAPRK